MSDTCPGVSCCPAPLFAVTNPNPPPPTLPVVPPPVTPTTYYNTEQTGSATCPSGSPTETATIAAGLYSSTVSQLAANQAAQNAANQAAQALLAGQCSNSTPPVVAAQLSGLLWQLPLVQDYYETTTPVQTVTAQAVTIPAAIGAAFTIPVASTNGFSGGGITVNG